MLQKLRHEKILNELDTQHAVKVTELAKTLDISESTIRRDIIELDRMGRLRKVFGGAVSLEGLPGITNVEERNRINIEEKESIAKLAASMIEDNDFVYMDAGTTTDRMIDYLEKKKVKFVTNGIAHAGKLVKKGFDVYMIGGILRHSTEAVIGPAAIEAVRQYNFTKCFMGANGVDIERGFSTPDASEAAVKTAVMQRASVSFVLADHTKFGRISSVTFAGIGDAYIITDRVEDLRYHRETVIKEAEPV